jgi:hypothetical protein
MSRCLKRNNDTYLPSRELWRPRRSDPLKKDPQRDLGVIYVMDAKLDGDCASKGGGRSGVHRVDANVVRLRALRNRPQGDRGRRHLPDHRLRQPRAPVPARRPEHRHQHGRLQRLWRPVEQVNGANERTVISYDLLGRVTVATSPRRHDDERVGRRRARQGQVAEVGQPGRRCHELHLQRQGPDGIREVGHRDRALPGQPWLRHHRSPRHDQLSRYPGPGGAVQGQVQLQAGWISRKGHRCRRMP